MRFPSQGEEQENAYPSVLDGLQKRHPLQHVKEALTGGIGKPLVHFINRDPAERYVVLAYGSSQDLTASASKVYVWDLTTGETVPVYSQAGWGNTPDFSYLALDDNPVASSVPSDDFDVMAGSWTVSGAISPAQVTMTPPLGTRYFGTSLTTKVYKIGNSGTSGATY